MTIIKQIFKFILRLFPPKKVISTIGPQGKYISLSVWQDCRCGNLVERHTIEIAELMPGCHDFLVLENHRWNTDKKNYVITRGSHEKTNLK